MSNYAARIQEGLIAALATPLGQSALAVIRTSGPGCIAALVKGFSRPAALVDSPGNSMVYGELRFPKTSGAAELVDEVVLGVFRAPRSYTGEDMVEIYCHGSVPGIERIFGLLFELGFRQAAGGEFSLRAFLNGKMDLTRAEAVQEIVTARSRSAQVYALHRLGGAVFQKIDSVKQALVKVLAMVSIQLDYPDDEIDDIQLPVNELLEHRKSLDKLAASYQAGKIYQHGVRLALAGRTNAGKSSLFNALVREERAIVSEIHGTTRDYLEAPFSIKGIPVRLFDTAGLRDVDEAIEAEGIRRSGQVIESSALVFYLIDGTLPISSIKGTLSTNEVDNEAPGDTVVTDSGTLNLSDLHAEDQRHLSDIAKQGISCILVWTKSDDPSCNPPPSKILLPYQPESAGAEVKAATRFDPNSAHRQTLDVVAVSSTEQTGIDTLLELAANKVMHGTVTEDADVLIDSERQYNLLLRSSESLERVVEAVKTETAMDLLALDLQDAIQALGEITGEVTSDDVLEAMFSGFCVGK